MTEFDTGFLDWRKETGRRAEAVGRADRPLLDWDIDPHLYIWPRHPRSDWHERFAKRCADLFEGQKATPVEYRWEPYVVAVREDHPDGSFTLHPRDWSPS